jgi:hypothetical protein
MQGCQIFLGARNQNVKKYINVAAKVHNGSTIDHMYFKWPRNTLNVSPQGLIKCAGVGVFCLKINHLATLAGCRFFDNSKNDTSTRP